MIDCTQLESLLAQVFWVAELRDGARIKTHCIYPSNKFVQVALRGGPDTFYVSDDGGAIADVEAAGGMLEDPDGLLRHLVSQQGLSIQHGNIVSPRCKAEDVPVAIAFVANASRLAAEWLFAHTRIHKGPNFKELVGKYLRQLYSEQLRPESIVGKSSRTHKFDNVIVWGESRRLSIDPVLHDAASLYSRLAANLDVKGINLPNLDQWIVYDDKEQWTASELTLLRLGAPVIKFSAMVDQLSEYTATACVA
jgi:hypothetical protein